MAKRVFISGGTGTIGGSLVRRFAEDGYDLELTYNTNVEQAHEFESHYGARLHHIDYLRDWQAPESQVDVLINNAGVNLSGLPLAETTDDELRNSFEVNVVAAARLAREFSPGMKQRGFGRIININSLYGLRGPALRLSYAMSKFAMRAMTGSLSQELAPFGITVNDICPGPVNSAMLRRMGERAVEVGRFSDVDQYLAEVGSEVPIGRLIEPSEVAAVAAFLAGPSAAACTGLAIRVDGGMLG